MIYQDRKCTNTHGQNSYTSAHLIPKREEASSRPRHVPTSRLSRRVSPASFGNMRRNTAGRCAIDEGVLIEIIAAQTVPCLMPPGPWSSDPACCDEVLGCEGEARWQGEEEEAIGRTRGRGVDRLG